MEGPQKTELKKKKTEQVTTGRPSGLKFQDGKLVVEPTQFEKYDSSNWVHLPQVSGSK